MARRRVNKKPRKSNVLLSLESVLFCHYSSSFFFFFFFLFFFAMRLFVPCLQNVVMAMHRRVLERVSLTTYF